MFLKIKPCVVFDINHNLILQYSTSVNSHTYFKELLLELKINSYKVGIIFSPYLIMKAKWKSWSVIC